MLGLIVARAAAVATCLDLLTADQVRALTEAPPALEALAAAMRQPAPGVSRPAPLLRAAVKDQK